MDYADHEREFAIWEAGEIERAEADRAWAESEAKFLQTVKDGGSMDFVVKDSGKREEFASGMVRDTQDGKVDYTSILDGPMFERWAAHLTKAKAKYADVRPGVANWMLADGEAELQRFRKSAMRHFIQWMSGDRTEDHAAATFFNINGVEYVRTKMEQSA